MAKYIRLFETQADFNAAYNGSEYQEPWVSYCEESDGPVLTVSGFSTSEYNFNYVGAFQNTIQGFVNNTGEDVLQVWVDPGSDWLHAWTDEENWPAIGLSTNNKIKYIAAKFRDPEGQVDYNWGTLELGQTYNSTDFYDNKVEFIDDGYDRGPIVSVTGERGPGNHLAYNKETTVVTEDVTDPGAINF